MKFLWTIKYKPILNTLVPDDKISWPVVAIQPAGTRYFVTIYFLAGAPSDQARSAWPQPVVLGLRVWNTPAFTPLRAKTAPWQQVKKASSYFCLIKRWSCFISILQVLLCHYEEIRKLGICFKMQLCSKVLRCNFSWHLSILL